LNISLNSCGLFIIAVRNALPSILPVNKVSMLNLLSLLTLQGRQCHQREWTWGRILSVLFATFPTSRKSLWVQTDWFYYLYFPSYNFEYSINVKTAVKFETFEEEGFVGVADSGVRCCYM
jgi:hypothetical protein